MNKSLKELLLTHIKTFYREPGVLFWAIGFPILMAWVLGLAFTEKRETVRTVYVIADSVPSSFGKEITAGETPDNAFKILLKKASAEEAVSAIKKGIITLYIELKKDSVIYHFDPSNPDAPLTHLMLERALFCKTPEVHSAVQVLNVRGTRYIDFLIPGLMAFGIMNSCLWGIGWSLIEFRMKKLLRRMVATPMRKSIFLISPVLIRVVLSMTESLILFAFAYLYFGTTITGSIAAFLLVYVAGVLAFSGIGILTASRTSSSQVGNGLINAVTLPMTILSGIFFNYHNFPEWAIPVIQAFPLTLLADAMRAIFTEGAGIKEVFMPFILLLTTGLVTFVTGLRLFKWY